ncbi:hypothetical protein FQR65_LT14215 [Abscondita terminalis]|nr:hypothetical protein FQR65_LT14215 [Abscondita terminalis]
MTERQCSLPYPKNLSHHQVGEQAAGKDLLANYRHDHVPWNAGRYSRGEAKSSCIFGSKEHASKNCEKAREMVEEAVEKNKFKKRQTTRKEDKELWSGEYVEAKSEVRNKGGYYHHRQPGCVHKCKKEIDAVYELHSPSVKEELVTENIKTEEIVDDDLILFNTDIPLYNEESISVNNFFIVVNVITLLTDKNALTRSCLLTRFKCDQCGYTTSDNNLLINHERIHRTTGYLQCNVCDYICTESHSLDEHLLSILSGRLFSCNMCDYETNRKARLNEHKFVHSEEKPFKCRVCDYGCKSSKTLKTHLSKHLGERAYGCDHKTYTNYELQYHKGIHSEEKAFKCGLCDYSSNFSNDLKTHLRKHLDEPSYGYSCDKCNFKTYAKSLLQRHKIVHSDEKPLKCGLCEYSCNFSNNLKKAPVEAFRSTTLQLRQYFFARFDEHKNFEKCPTSFLTPFQRNESRYVTVVLSNYILSHLETVFNTTILIPTLDNFNIFNKSLVCMRLSSNLYDDVDKVTYFIDDYVWISPIFFKRSNFVLQYIFDKVTWMMVALVFAITTVTWWLITIAHDNAYSWNQICYSALTVWSLTICGCVTAPPTEFYNEQTLKRTQSDISVVIDEDWVRNRSPTPTFYRKLVPTKPILKTKFTDWDSVIPLDTPQTISPYGFGFQLTRIGIENQVFIRNLCRKYEQETKLAYPNILPNLQLSDYNNKESRITNDGYNIKGSNIAVDGKIVKNAI